MCAPFLPIFYCATKATFEDLGGPGGPSGVPCAVEKAAAKKSYDELKIEQAEKLRYTIAMKNYMDEFNTHFNTYRNANGEIDFANAYRAKLAQDNISNTPNIERQTDIERGKAHQLMADLLDQAKVALAGQMFNGEEPEDEQLDLDFESDDDGGTDEEADAEDSEEYAVDDETEVSDETEEEYEEDANS